MDDRTVERVESWESRSLSGHGDLHQLAEEEFSGVLAAGGDWLFMLNGRVVGVSGGEIEAFADATAYEAPDPALPLLFAMEEIGGERRGEYYTGDTPLTEVDETLSEGSFTGYLCLSENVYSGDYYLVYYGGRAMPVGFVGSEERLVTGEEARESAEEEVGIYDVVSVAVDVRDVPEPEPDAAAGDGAGAAATASEDPDTDEEADPDGVNGAVESAEPDAEPDDAAVDEPEPSTEGEQSDETDPDPEPADSSEPDPRPTEPEEPFDAPAESTTSETEEQRASPDPRARAASSDDAVFEDEQRWRQTRTIPALDPDQSEDDDADGAGAVPDEETGATSRRNPDARETAPDDGSTAGSGGAGGAERVESLQSELADRERRIEELESRQEELSAERDELRSEVEDLEARIEELTAERDRLQEELDAHDEGAGAVGGGPGDLTAEAALGGTNLFIRPETKTQPTLEDALDGDASAADARSNLSVTRHTEFDESEATVEGVPYGQFLRDTLERRFVEWVVTDLPFEISDTGHESGLADLYDALPEIDRADIRGTVEAEAEDGETVSRSFDLVFRNRMGEPLAVVEFNAGRDPVESGKMESLVEDTTAVAGEDVAAAFYVTASFFEPGALEVTEEATKSGLLSRGSRESFVNVSRKRGFHLCLVESRDGTFYVSVPEL